MFEKIAEDKDKDKSAEDAILDAAVPLPQLTDTPSYNKGDTFDEDTGDHIGNVEWNPDDTPVNISVYVDGYWYIYKLDRKEKADA